MDKNYLKVALCVAAALLLFGCATPKAVSTFSAQDLNPMLQGGAYLPKVNNFVVILDKSGSMGTVYKGQKKLDYAKDMVCRMNQTIPDIPLTGSLRIFGRMAVFCNQFTKLLWGPAPYQKGAINDALNQVGFSVGDSPLNTALDETAKDLKAAQGDIAVIIFTDGNKHYMNYDAVRKSVAALKSQYGSRLCIYPVQIGQDPEGKKLLAEVAQAGQCGYFVNADDIASSQGMADFVSRVFLKKAQSKPEPVKEVVKEVVVEKVVILDSDGDGVSDNLDKCPGTPKGARVDKFGCWVLEHVLFDFDKYNIKLQYYHLLDEVARVFKMNPDLRVIIEGHTDNIGTAAYNMKLSFRRANAVKEYLINRGVAGDKMKVEGFGFTRPVASNATAEGRALNRRVQFTPVP